MEETQQTTPMPMGLGPRFKYGPVIQRIVAGAGDWVRIELDELLGDSSGVKQARLNQAARQRGLKVTSTFRYPGVCFARLVASTEVGPR